MLSILHRYVLRELFKSFIMTLLVLSGIMLLGAVYKILRTGVGVSDLLRFLPYTIPYLLAWVVPAALLTACVMTFGRMAAENELTAVCASGIPLRYMCYPAFLVSILLTSLAIPLNDSLIPKSRVVRDAVLKEAFLRDPLALTPLGGQETIEIGEYKVYVESVTDHILNNVIVIAPKKDEDQETGPVGDKPDEDGGKPEGRPAARPAEAKPRDSGRAQREVYVYRANMARYTPPSESEGGRSLRIELIDAQYTIVTPGRNARSWFNVSAEQQVMVIPTPEDPADKVERRSNMTTRALMRRNRELERDLAKASTGPSRQRAIQRRLTHNLTEIRLRETLAFSTIALCLVGMPLGIWMRRESRLASFAIAVIVFLMLYALIAGGEGMAIAERVPPGAALWTPNVLIGALGIGMLLHTFRR
jgi:lipopolysaccharide export LptBFGC system permease protein LptF